MKPSSKIKVVSGGQSGVDRAALDAARSLGMAYGGWCPQGRTAEDGKIALHYPLKETPGYGYSQRTEWNVRDSDATLILSWGEPTGGTKLTVHLAEQHQKPYFQVDMSLSPPTEAAKNWLQQNGVSVLNIAGPRGSSSPRTYPESLDFLTRLFQSLIDE